MQREANVCIKVQDVYGMHYFILGYVYDSSLKGQCVGMK